jgi:hypothetical protein
MQAWSGGELILGHEAHPSRVLLRGSRVNQAYDASRNRALLA